MMETYNYACQLYIEDQHFIQSNIVDHLFRRNGNENSWYLKGKESSVLINGNDCALLNIFGEVQISHWLVLNA